MYLTYLYARDNKVSLTHVCIKAVAQGLLCGRESLNGKIVFGKFIPQETIDISCLVDVGGGKDLASLLIENVDNLTLEEIAQFINKKAAKVKTSEDKEHQKRVGPFKYMPPMYFDCQYIKDNGRNFRSSSIHILWAWFEHPTSIGTSLRLI